MTRRPAEKMWNRVRNEKSIEFKNKLKGLVSFLREAESTVEKSFLGEKNYKVHISLTNRKKMKYPVLIGRRFLNRFKYMVNVRKKNINDRAKAL